MTGKHWTPNEIQFLEDNYTVRGTRYCCKHLSKSYKSITVKAARLGLSTGFHKPWTDEDKQLLHDNYLVNGIAWCSKQLGRSYGSVRQHAYSIMELSFYSRDNCVGENNPFYGKTHSKEARCKMGRPMPRGKDSHLWRGGTTPKTSLRVLSAKWYHISNEIRQRDRNTCQRCGKKYKRRGMSVHHIVPFRLCGVDHCANLICLCMSCHAWADANLRESIPLLQSILLKGGWPI